jgi:antitoxin HigA-1
MMTKRDFTPIHPGEILLTEFLQPIGVSPYRLAKDISVPVKRVVQIVHGSRAISANTALRLGRFFKMEAEFWLNLQNHYDIEVAMEALEARLDKEAHPFSAISDNLSV